MLTIFLQHLTITLIAIVAVGLMHVAAVASQERLAPLRESIVLWWNNEMTWRNLMWAFEEAPIYLPRKKREGCVHE